MQTFSKQDPGPGLYYVLVEIPVTLSWLSKKQMYPGLGGAGRHTHWHYNLQTQSVLWLILWECPIYGKQTSQQKSVNGKKILLTLYFPISVTFALFQPHILTPFKSTRRYGPLRGPTSSFGRGRGFFCPSAKKRPYYAVLARFGNFWCPVVTLVNFSSKLSNFERNPKKKQKNHKNLKKNLKNRKI